MLNLKPLLMDEEECRRYSRRGSVCSTSSVDTKKLPSSNMVSYKAAGSADSTVELFLTPQPCFKSTNDDEVRIHQLA